MYYLDGLANRQYLLDVVSKEDRDRYLYLARCKLLPIITQTKQAILEFAQIDRPELERLFPLLACCGLRL